MHLYLPPSKIFYTQADIYELFGKGSNHYKCSVKSTWEDVRLGRTKVQDFPPIHVIRRYNKYWTSDNRRLWIFKKAEKHGICCSVKVREVPCNDHYLSLWNERFTTTNGGTEITFRKAGRGTRCEFCSQWLRNPEELKDHKNSARSGHMIRCDNCEREFRLATQFEDHKHNNCRPCLRKLYQIQQAASKEFSWLNHVPETNEAAKTPSSSSSYGGCGSHQTITSADEKTIPVPETNKVYKSPSSSRNYGACGSQTLTSAGEKRIPVPETNKGYKSPSSSRHYAACGSHQTLTSAGEKRIPGGLHFPSSQDTTVITDQRPLVAVVSFPESINSDPVKKSTWSSCLDCLLCCCR